jgi:TRAP-type mannitol/chloroaromatic compound transport system permease small subunit
VQLMTGTFTPPTADIAGLGLSSWVLPGVWLLVTVAVPSALASWFAWRRSPRTTVSVLWASALLALELVVQVPFVGLSALQLVLGVFAVLMAAAATRARRLGWRRDGGGTSDA